MASLQGWGRETWGSGAWGEYAPVTATGDGLTSSAATPTITGDCNITLTGVYGNHAEFLTTYPAGHIGDSDTRPDQPGNLG